LNSVQQIQAQIGEKIERADPAVQNAVQSIPTVAPSVQAKPELVSDGNRELLLKKIGDFVDHTQYYESLYGRWALGLIIGAAVLALTGAIFSFARQHIVAGIAGLIVTAMISFSNAYPLNALADFYRGLYSQASSLQVDCQLKQPFTVDSYNSAANQLKLLYVAEGQRPGFGNYKIQTRDLQTELQSVKTSYDSVEKAKVAVEALEKGSSTKM